MRHLLFALILTTCSVAQADHARTQYGRTSGAYYRSTYRHNVPLTDYALGINRYSRTSPTYGYGYTSRYRYTPSYRFGYSLGRSFRRCR